MPEFRRRVLNCAKGLNGEEGVIDAAELVAGDDDDVDVPFCILDFGFWILGSWSQWANEIKQVELFAQRSEEAAGAFDQKEWSAGVVE